MFPSLWSFAGGCRAALSAGTEIGERRARRLSTGVPTCRLPLWVQGVDVHGEVQFVPDHLLVLAGELVGAVDALGVPVGPVEAVLKHGDGEWMREA